ncbi:MAG: DUF3316 domain-containing protein [Tannerella sp.]|jgi:hypothetical protein|nr:DUF3316 domain-containing protein [Tannerella sp.]
MKNLNTTALPLCACLFLSISLSAQTLSGDSAVSPRMSPEKADSLLIALSREKAASSRTETPDSHITAADTAAVTAAAAAAAGTPAAAPARKDSVATDAPRTAVTVAESPEKSRKKANVRRSELLIEQDGGTVRRTDEDGIDYANLRSVNEGTLVGVGGYRMRDTYLSPENYGGAGFRFMNERMRLTKSPDSRVSRQNVVNVDISSTMNGAENANFLSAFVDYSLGYHYLFLPDPYLKIKIGGSARGMLGMVYNTRNGNNPMTVHADVDLNFSLLAIYEFHIRKHPLAIRYQFETPFAGILFSPVYNQSYYEIFSLGNTAEIFNVNSFNNKFAMRNYLTLDFPAGGMTLRAGYFGIYYSTHIHDIDRYIISHNVMLGFVKEFVAFGGREMRKRNLFHSAYY